MEPAIRVENLGKRYRVSNRGDRARYATLRDSVARVAGAPLRWARQGFAPADPAEDFWALKDVSFEVMPGEVVGIIGRNGAGKSTLLKVLSRITKPTTGRVTLNGRVGSLLEVGTGFHPELTGRENVYLNGSILGMSRREIAAKFDEIVAFAEIERFLDTPVKRYSSGMYVRLAFAVAAHLEPEILIVDEVLAVGDVNFQKKCINKMKDVGRLGRTVLVVSHDTAAVNRLCSRAILLNAGKITAEGPTAEIVDAHLREASNRSVRWDSSVAPASTGSKVARLLSVQSGDSSGEVGNPLNIRRPLNIRMEYEVLEKGWVLVPNVHVHNDRGECLFVLHDWGEKWRRTPRPTGRYVSTVEVPGNFLPEGVLSIGAALTTYEPLQTVHFYEQDAVSVFVVDDLEGDSARGDYVGHLPGAVRPLFNWASAGPERV